jgi:hypothetical protein
MSDRTTEDYLFGRNGFWRLILELDKTRARPDFNILKRKYWKLTTALDKKYPDSYRTKSEKDLIFQFRIHTRLQILTSFWIGFRNFDLFFPRVAGYSMVGDPGRMRGLVIEVDGSIHNETFKLKKDLAKQRLLHELGIGLATIENCDLNESTVVAICKNLAKQNTHDHRSKIRLWRKIFLITLASHLPKHRVLSLFGIDSSKPGSFQNV